VAHTADLRLSKQEMAARIAIAGLLTAGAIGAAAQAAGRAE
jgi:hypothetical protein